MAGSKKRSPNFTPLRKSQLKFGPRVPQNPSECEGPKARVRVTMRRVNLKQTNMNIFAHSKLCYHRKNRSFSGHHVLNAINHLFTFGDLRSRSECRSAASRADR